MRDAVADDREAWRHLWNGYLSHYRSGLPVEQTEHTFARCLEPETPMWMRVVPGAHHRLDGFAIHVLHPSTWARGESCYLEDLYVDPHARGRGVARALIDDLIAQGRAKGWSHVYWVTEADNIRARALYDSYTLADGYVRYRLTL